MRPIDGISSFRGRLSPKAPRGAPASKKAKGASDLRDQGEDEARLPRQCGREHADSNLDHSGTDEPVPFRNGSPNAVFAAQLLGQLLPNAGQPSSRAAIAAYKEIALRLRLYDRIL